MLMVEMLGFVLDKWTSVSFCSSWSSNHKVVIVVASHNRLLIDKHVSALLKRVAVWKLFRGQECWVKVQKMYVCA